MIDIGSYNFKVIKSWNFVALNISSIPKYVYKNLPTVNYAYKNEDQKKKQYMNEFCFFVKP